MINDVRTCALAYGLRSMVLGHIKASGAKELAGSVSNFGLFTGKKNKQSIISTIEIQCINYCKVNIES